MFTSLHPCPPLLTRVCRSGRVTSYDRIADSYDVEWLSEQPHDATGTPRGPRIVLVNSTRSKPATELNREISTGRVTFAHRGSASLHASRPHLLSPALGGVVLDDGS